MERYTKVYRCPDDISNFKIRVKLLEVKTEDSGEHYHQEENIFKWQEKVYGKYEREFYSDEKNCITDLDKKYHNEIKNLAENEDFMHTYTSEDDFRCDDQPSTSNYMSALCQNVKSLTFNEVTTKEYNLEDYLNAAIANPVFNMNDEAMYIVADFGEYYENTWIKSEYVLVTLRYNTEKKILSIYPDFTTLEPYVLQTSGDINRTFKYFLENASKTMPEEAALKEVEILKKITAYKRNLQMQEYLLNFELPPKNILDIYLFAYIECAKNFEHDYIYVQYFIDLPEPWRCKNVESLKGCTQTCVTRGPENLAYFGFPFEICLEYNIQNLKESVIPKPPYIYFEVISKDTWDRYRTEGLTYKALPISQPGMYTYNLTCFRISPKSPLAQMRRFFIGDYSNYNDISWVGLPKDHEGPTINKYGVNTIGTGEIEVKFSIIHQSQAFISDTLQTKNETREGFLLEKLKSSHLIKSVEQVLQAFKRARQNMIEIRKKV